jgi:hypothetical protein
MSRQDPDTGKHSRDHDHEGEHGRDHGSDFSRE